MFSSRVCDGAYIGRNARLISMLGMVMVAVLAQSPECRFKADWWLPYDVEIRSRDDVTLGRIAAQFDDAFPPVKADVLVMSDRTLVSFSSRGAHLEFQMKTLPGACAERRLGVPTARPRVDEALPRIRSYWSGGLNQFSDEVELRAGVRKVLACRIPLTLLALDGQPVGRLDANTPFELKERSDLNVQLRLDGPLSKVKVFARAAEVDACTR